MIIKHKGRKYRPLLYNDAVVGKRILVVYRGGNKKLREEKITSIRIDPNRVGECTYFTYGEDGGRGSSHIWYQRTSYNYSTINYFIEVIK